MLFSGTFCAEWQEFIRNFPLLARSNPAPSSCHPYLSSLFTLSNLLLAPATPDLTLAEQFWSYLAVQICQMAVGQGKPRPTYMDLVVYERMHQNGTAQGACGPPKYTLFQMFFFLFAVDSQRFH